MRSCLGVFLFCVLAWPMLAGEPGVVTERNVVYANAGDVALELDIARPKGEGPYAAVVCVHGGGWRGGKRQDLNMLVDRLAKNNFVAATVTYRLAPKHTFPAQIEDCRGAVRFLRANAEKYKLKKDKIGAVGFSAGGHLVSLMGASDDQSPLNGEKPAHAKESSRVQAVVNFFGPTDFSEDTWSKQVQETFLIPFLGGKLAERTENYRKASPMLYVTKDDPPFLFIHGDKDELVPIRESEQMTKKLQSEGVSARLITMKGDAHGWGGEKLEKTLQETISFFDEKLRK